MTPRSIGPGDRGQRGDRWFEAALDAMTDLVLIKGPRSRLLWANKAFRDYYGMTNEELYQLIDGEQSDPDDTLQYVQDDHVVFTTGRVLDVPAEPVTDARGEVGWFHTIKSPIVSDRGIEATVGVSRPLDDAELIERSVRDRGDQKASVAALRTLVRSLPTAVAMFDVHGRFLAHSADWAATFGVADDLLAGDLDVDEVHGPDFPLGVALQEAVEAEKAGVELLQLTRRSGRNRLYEAHVRPWFNADDTVGGSIALLHDVTDLEVSRRDLAKANEELAAFNYRLSHDLVSPLTTSMGLLQMMSIHLAEGDIERLAQLHVEVDAQLRDLDDLVRRLRRLARSDAPVEAATLVDLEELVTGVLHAHAERIRASQIETLVDIEVPAVQVERRRIEQIVESLISNAVKFHHPDRSARYLRVWARSPEPGVVVLSVTDNGVGIPDAEVAHVFELFGRASSHHTGHGLGLSLVQRHAQELGGQARVANASNDTVIEVVFRHDEARARP